MKWFKFYGQDYLSDPKIINLNACERSCWITLLAYGSINDNGVVHFLSEEQLLIQSGITPKMKEWKKTLGILMKLKNLKMITHDNETITILNWGKRQGEALTSYERIKRYRARHKYDNAVTTDDNEMITLEENRIEKNRKEYNNIILPLKEKFKKTKKIMRNL